MISPEWSRRWKTHLQIRKARTEAIRISLSKKASGEARKRKCRQLTVSHTINTLLIIGCKEMPTMRDKVARCRSKWLFPENILKFFVCFHCSSKQMPYLCPTFQLPLGMVSNHGCISIIGRGLSWWQSSLFFKETARLFSDLPLYFYAMPTECCRGDFYRRPYDLHIINTKNLRRIQPFMYLCTQNEGTTQAKVVTNHREIAHRA